MGLVRGGVLLVFFLVFEFFFGVLCAFPPVLESFSECVFLFFFCFLVWGVVGVLWFEFGLMSVLLCFYCFTLPIF